MSKRFVIVFFLLIHGCSEINQHSLQSDSYLPEIRLKLLALKDNDQKVRQFNTDNKKPTNKQLEQLKKVDDLNTQYIINVVKRYGWPSVKMIGKDGVNAFWLILQHTNDYKFQKEALHYITDLHERGELTAQSYSLYIDRVLIHDGKPQRYGTQIKGWDGKNPILFDMEDPGNVNLRRQSIGLFSIEDYFSIIKQYLYPNEEFDEQLDNTHPDKDGSMGFQVDVEWKGTLRDKIVTSLIVSQVSKGSSAESSGLQYGDSIIEINGIRVFGENPMRLMNSLNVSAGDSVNLVVTQSNGQDKKLVIVASEKTKEVE